VLYTSGVSLRKIRRHGDLFSSVSIEKPSGDAVVLREIEQLYGELSEVVIPHGRRMRIERWLKELIGIIVATRISRAHVS
jgi:hypothetical protein